MAWWCSPYSSAVGSSSSNEINTIMPATAANTTPKTVSVKKFRSTSQPMSAPSGSDNPDAKESQKPFCGSR